MTQQRRLVSQNSSAKEAQAARIVQTFCNFRSSSRRLKSQLKATLRARLAALIFCALEMMKGGFDPLPSGEERGGEVTDREAFRVLPHALWVFFLFCFFFFGGGG